jgi:hypothetical protein
MKDDALLNSFNKKRTVETPVVQQFKSLPATLFNASRWSNSLKEHWKNDAISLRNRFTTKQKNVEQGLEWVCLALAMPISEKVLKQTLISNSQLKESQFWELYYRIIQVVQHKRSVDSIKHMSTLYEVPKGKCVDAAEWFLQQSKDLCTRLNIPWLLEERELTIAAFVLAIGSIVRIYELSNLKIV